MELKNTTLSYKKRDFLCTLNHMLTELYLNNEYHPQRFVYLNLMIQLSFYNYFFDFRFDLESLKVLVRKNNKNIKILYKKTQRIIYVQGSYDPWSTLGITNTNNTNTVAILINGNY